MTFFRHPQSDGRKHLQNNGHFWMYRIPLSFFDITTFSRAIDTYFTSVRNTHPQLKMAWLTVNHGRGVKFINRVRSRDARLTTSLICNWSAASPARPPLLYWGDEENLFTFVFVHRRELPSLRRKTLFRRRRHCTLSTVTAQYNRRIRRKLVERLLPLTPSLAHHLSRASSPLHKLYYCLNLWVEVGRQDYLHPLTSSPTTTTRRTTKTTSSAQLQFCMSVYCWGNDTTTDNDQDISHRPIIMPISVEPSLRVADSTLPPLSWC